MSNVETTAKNDILKYDLKPSQITEAMSMAYKIRDSLMIWGSPGIGKSAIARAFADNEFPLRRDNIEKLRILREQAEDSDYELVTEEYLKKFEASLLDQDTNFVDFRLSQIDPSDLRGIPIPVKLYFSSTGHQILESEIDNYPGYVTKTSVVWAAPSMLQLPPDWKGVILFDEINSAMPIVQAASYQLILDRCIGELKLPDTALILAAGNRENDGGVTFPLATPLRDRMTHVEMIADYVEWVETYAIPKRLNVKTIAYVNHTGNRNFNTLNPKDTSHAGGTSPRSWERVSDIENLRESTDMSVPVYKAYIAGRIGNAAAIDYVTYIENMADLPAPELILTGEYRDFSEFIDDVSKNYFIVLNLVFKLVDMNEKKKSKEISVAEWNTYCTNFLEFIDFNFEATQKELIIHAIRSITSAGVNISYSEVPAFKEFVTKYGPLLRKVRMMN